jgi:hypothetical protein
MIPPSLEYRIHFRPKILEHWSGFTHRLLRPAAHSLSRGIDDYDNEQDVMDCAKIYGHPALALMRR